MQNEYRRLLIAKSSLPQFIEAIGGVLIKSEPAIASHSGGRWMHPGLDVYRGRYGALKVVRFADDTQPYPIARGSIPAGFYVVLGHDTDLPESDIAALPMVRVFTGNTVPQPLPATIKPLPAGFIQQSLFE